MTHTPSAELNYSASPVVKTTARDRRNLPSSPRKRKAVIRRLHFQIHAKEFHPKNLQLFHSL